MDKELLSEAGKYLKDVSSQGFQTYVDGLWVTSVVWASIGVLLLVLSVICLFTAIKFYKLEYIVRKEEESNAGTILSGCLMVMFLIFGLALLFTNLSGIIAPEYVAINELIQSIKVE